MKEIRYIIGLARAVGVFKAATILIFRACGIRHTVTARSGALQILVRPQDSDFAVLSQIFGWREYEIDPERLSKLQDTAREWKEKGIQPIIVDAGANVGYSSLFFREYFPNTTILAIEPCSNAFAMLCRHVKDHPNILTINAALWSHEGGLELSGSLGASWGNSVKEGKGVPSRRLDTLLRTVTDGRALIIKLDIEGAEREVIDSCPHIFAEAKCLLIEPHDFDNPGFSCLSPLYAALAGRRFDTVISGENIAFFSSDLFGHSKSLPDAI